MSNDEQAFGKLRNFLGSLPAGVVSDVVALARLLSPVWHMFAGSEEEGMEGSKLLTLKPLKTRIEQPQWQPPHLTFEIERHGATVLGSSRAEVHTWKLDVHHRRAEIASRRRRQVRPADKRFDAKAVADELAPFILAGEDHKGLKWSPGRKRVRLISDVLARTMAEDPPKQTVDGRMKKLRAQLVPLLVGWRDAGRGFFERA